MKNCVTTFAALAVAAAALSGCGMLGTRRPVANAGTKYYAVTTEAAPFYRYGPQQGNGPDLRLPRNTLVTLIRPSFGYSKVQVLDSHQQGYVASEDIQVAPASLVASATATPPPVAAVSPPTGEQFNLNSTDPRLNAPPEQLPAPDLPPPADVPAPEPSPQAN